MFTTIEMQEIETQFYMKFLGCQCFFWLNSSGKESKMSGLEKQVVWIACNNGTLGTSLANSNLNPAMSMLKMRGINGADVFAYFKPLITKQIR